MPPKPPPAHGPSPHPGLPHERKKIFGIFTARSLIFGIVIGTVITGIIGLVLNYFAVSPEVILPVLAPIWVGAITLSYTILNQMH